jgi:hypothetical protein
MSVLREGRVPGSLVPAALGAIMLALAGCGTAPSGGSSVYSSGSSVEEESLPPALCSRAPSTNREAKTLIVLDWNGGLSPIDTRSYLSPLNPADLPIYDAPATQAEIEAFKEEVRARVEIILCDLDPVDMRVITGRAADYPAATHVHLTHDLAPSGGRQAGQADYDPCNLYVDDTVLIWGGRIAEVAGPGWLRHEWAHILANVTTHEIGHTLGFSHPDEQGLTTIDPDVARRAIMMSSHTVTALVGPQTFLIPQTTCPAATRRASGGVNYEIVSAFLNAAAMKAPSTAVDDGSGVLSCRHGHEYLEY